MLRAALSTLSAVVLVAASATPARAVGLPAFPPADFAERLEVRAAAGVSVVGAAVAVAPQANVLQMSWSRSQAGVALNDGAGRTNMTVRPGFQGEYEVSGVAGGEGASWRAVLTGKGSCSVFGPGLYASISPYRNDWDAQGRYGYAIAIRTDAGESVVLARSAFNAEPRALAVREKGMDLNAMIDRQGGRLSGSYDDLRVSSRDAALIGLLLALTGL